MIYKKKTCEKNASSRRNYFLGSARVAGDVELQSMTAAKNTDIRNSGFKLGCAQKKVAISDSAWERIIAKN